ncbi:MAG: hypothetical protein ACLPKI_00715 [Streptosporangiaceae bacterium]
MRYRPEWRLVYAASEEAVEHLSNSASNCLLELGVSQVFDTGYNQRMDARDTTNYYAYDIDYLSSALNIARDRSGNDIGPYGS